MSTPLRVTASGFTQPIIGLLETPTCLDGLIAWVMAQTTPGLPPITPHHAEDLDLPLARWEQHGTWGWCASQARYEPQRWVAVDIRRRPATAEMARYTTVEKHHLGLGPHKARNTLRQAAWVDRITWDVDTTDPDRLHDLLTQITHIGKHTNIGYGHLTTWTIEPGSPDAWRDRPMPTPGTTGAYRPPYWHPTRRYTP